MEHFKIKIERPFVLHINEVLDIQKLKEELLLYKNVSKSSGRDFGLYVYNEGYDYPHSSAFGVVHTWHNGEKFIHHIDENIKMFGGGEYVLKRGKNNSVGLEKVNK